MVSLKFSKWIRDELQKQLLIKTKYISRACLALDQDQSAKAQNIHHQGNNHSYHKRQILFIGLSSSSASNIKQQIAGSQNKYLCFICKFVLYAI